MPHQSLPFADAVKWNEDGLIPAIVQDVETGDVLMMAWMDEPALRDTLATGQTHLFAVPANRTGTKVRPPATYNISSRSGLTVMATSS